MFNFATINQNCIISHRWPKNLRTDIDRDMHGIKTVQFKAVAKPGTGITATDLSCTDANLLFTYLMQGHIKDCPNADAIQSIISAPFVATDTNTHGCRYNISYHFAPNGKP